MKRRRAGRRWLVLAFAGATAGAAGGVALYRAHSLPHQLERLRAELAIHDRLGREADALAAVERLVALDPRDLDAFERLVAQRVASGRGEEAERLLRARLGEDPDSRVVYLLAELLHGRGDEAQAARLLEPLLADLQQVRRVELRVRVALLGGRVLAEQGDLERARALLVECGRLRDSFGVRNATGDALVLDLLALADVLGRLGRWGEAEETLRRAHAMAADGPAVCDLLAATLERRGALDEAVAVLAAHWQARPSLRAARAGTYLAALVRAGRLDEARAAAAELEAEAPWATAFVGGLVDAGGAPAAAATAMREVLRLAGPAAQAHAVGAEAALEAGDLEAARAALTASLALEPERADLELELLSVELQLDDLAAARARALRLLAQPVARGQALEALLALPDAPDVATRQGLERLAEVALDDDAWPRLALALVRTLSGDLEGSVAAWVSAAALPDADLSGALALLARAHERRGDPAGTLELLDALARAHPSLAGARVARGRVLLALGRADLARDEVAQALAVRPDLGEALALRADLLEAAGDLPGAAAALESALEAGPGDVGLLRTLAGVRQRQGEPQVAVALLRPIVEANPHDAELRAALGRALALAGQRSQAETELQAALRLDPACEEAYGLAALHALAGAYGDARQVLEGCAAAGQVPHLQAALAAARALASDVAGQREALAQVVALPGAVADVAPAVVQAFHVALLLRALGWQEELTARARRLADEAAPDRLLVWWALDGLEADADPRLRLRLAERLVERTGGDGADLAAGLTLAEALEAAGEPARARALLEVLSARHDDALAWERLGEAHHGAGDRAAAIAAYERALALAPDRLVALNNLASALGADAAERPRAIGLARRALELAPPELAAVRDTLGWLLLLEGDLVAADRLLREAVALDPLDPGARYHLAQACRAQGDAAQARTLTRLALLSGAPFRQRAQAEALLARLEGNR